MATNVTTLVVMSPTSEQTQPVALVTGGNKGIGKAIVAGLARAGLTVFLGARDQARCARAVEDLASEGDIRLVVLDVTDAGSVRAAAKLIGGEFGRLDVLVNNAGVATGYRKPSEESADDLRYVYETNVFAVVSVIRSGPWPAGCRRRTDPRSGTRPAAALRAGSRTGYTAGSPPGSC